jgi:hypothetical protein
LQVAPPSTVGVLGTSELATAIMYLALKGKAKGVLKGTSADVVQAMPLLNII